MKKYIILLLSILLYKGAISQSMSPHKGILSKADTLYVEMVLPKKKDNTFKYYLYNSQMELISDSSITGTVGFSFDKAASAMLYPKLFTKEGVFETNLEDWSEFYYCTLKLTINGNAKQFMFSNQRMPKDQNNNSDGHSGHTH